MHSHFTNSNLAGVVLCGGQSQRMGRPKYSLPFGSETSLQRVVRSVSSITKQIVVVGMEEIEWPKLATPILKSIDPAPYPGPLAALVNGFEALPEGVSHVLLAGCDFPLIKSAFLQKLVNFRNSPHDIIVVQEQSFPQPFAAVYRRSTLSIAKSLLDADERSLQALLRRCQTRFIAAEEMRDVDPLLDSLQNMNTMQDYQRLLQRVTRSDSEDVESGPALTE